MNRCPTIRYPYAASAVRNATPTSASTRTLTEPVSPLSMRSDTVPNANCGAIWPSVINDTSTIPAAISHLNRRTTSHPPTAWSAMAASLGTGGRSVVTSTDSRSWRATLVNDGAATSADSSTASRAAGMCSATSSTAATITCSAGGGSCTTRSAMPCGNRRRVMSSTAVLGACARRRAKISSSSDGFTALSASSSTSTRGGETSARANAMRWRCPPDRVRPRSPSVPPRPPSSPSTTSSAAAAVSAARSMASSP